MRTLEVKMDHVVYMDAKAKELAEILNGEKTMIIRGAAGRKIPYGRVSQDDLLYLIENDGSGLVRARVKVASVFNSEKMTQAESIALVKQNQDKLQLTASQTKRWAGKRYLVLIEIKEVKALDGFKIDKSDFGNMDDWLPVGDIEKVKIDT
jgi:hypothetical protein